MFRLAASCLVVIAACVDQQQPSKPPPAVSSRVTQFDLPLPSLPQIDLVFVVDDTSAMGPYRDHLLAAAPSFAAAIETTEGGVPDLRIGVISSAGFHEVDTIDGNFLVDAKLADGSRARNYSGDLADALTKLLDVGATATHENDLLDGMRRALDAQTDFVRPYSYLYVILVSARDDRSLDPVDDYRDYLKTIYADPANVIVTGLYLRPAPRLDSLLSQFPNRTTYTSLDAQDLSTVFELFGAGLKVLLGVACIPAPLDFDWGTAGVQPDCSAHVTHFGSVEGSVVPLCGAAGPPCFELRDEPIQCGFGSEPFVSVRMNFGPVELPRNGRLIGECVTGN